MRKVGLLFFPRDEETVVGTVRVMEDLGYERVGLVDSHALAMDVYVGLTLAAVNSSRLRLGPCVTNPVTRDVSVTAAAMASVDALSGGRAYLGISRGFSGSRAVGIEPSKTSALATVVPRLRALMAGSSVDAGGRTIRLAWSRRSIPIIIAGSGPLALRIAGQVADGALLHMGLFPDVLEDAVAEIRRGAEEAGRDWREIELSVFGAAACSEDGEAARRSVRAAVAGMGASVFSPSTVGKRLPPELDAPVARLRREYLVTEHMQLGDRHNVDLIDRLELSDYLLDRFAFAGTPEELRAKVERIESMGIENFMFNVCMSADLKHDARMIAESLGLT